MNRITKGAFLGLGFSDSVDGCAPASLSPRPSSVQPAVNPGTTKGPGSNLQCNLVDCESYASWLTTN